MTAKTTYTATFKDGRTVTRESVPGRYGYAAKRNVGTQAGRGPTVTFHRTEAQARGIAGKSGEVVAVHEAGASRGAAGTCTVCQGAGTVTYGPSAVDGTYSTVTCHRCGGTGRRSA
jgi:hypothetical protein